MITLARGGRRMLTANKCGRCDGSDDCGLEQSDSQAARCVGCGRQQPSTPGSFFLVLRRALVQVHVTVLAKDRISRRFSRRLHQKDVADS